MKQLRKFLILLFITGCINTAWANVEEEEPFVVVEQMPEFPGGTDAMLQYISSELKYPAEAQKNDLQGRVLINFIVEKDGSVSDIKILRGVHPLLDAEAVRVVTSMPKWKPGIQRGKPVRVKYVLPITFKK